MARHRLFILVIVLAIASCGKVRAVPDGDADGDADADAGDALDTGTDTGDVPGDGSDVPGDGTDDEVDVPPEVCAGDDDCG
jgi:hypothetical protein